MDPVVILRSPFNMDEWFKHIPYWILILVLLVILGIHYTAPQVTKAVQGVQEITTPSKQIKQYPIMGCSISRIHFGIDYE